MTAPRVDAEECTTAYLGETLSLSVRVSGVESWGEPPPGRPLGRVRFYVKSLNPSVDELPLIAAVAEAAADSGVELDVYEYESIAGGGDRYARLARLLARALEAGSPFLVLIPQLMVVRLLDALPGGAVEERLSESVLARVRVEKEDILYTPTLQPPRGLEVVVKESSAASQARAELLESIIAAEGLKLAGRRVLPDNASIHSYVLERGLCTALQRLPVTRLARLLASLYACTGLSGLVARHRVGRGPWRDESLLTLYAYRVPPRLLEAIKSRLERLEALGWAEARLHAEAAGGQVLAALTKTAREEVRGTLESWWC